MTSFGKEALALTIDPASLNLATFPDLGTLVSKLLPPVVYISGLLLFAYLILGGFKYLTSAGDEKAVQEAKKIITNSLIGIFIVFSAFWILRIIETVLGLNVTGYNP